jgi:hypothetical protein
VLLKEVFGLSVCCLGMKEHTTYKTYNEEYCSE